MRYFYSHAKLPKDDRLLSLIEAAALRLERKLAGIDIHRIGLSDYMKKYFGKYQSNLRACLQLNSYILAWAIREAGKISNGGAFVDYGGGCGILAMLAKEAGIREVLYVDIYDVSCRDAGILGAETGNSADAYICGDMDDLISHVEKSSISVGMIASYDVIEHIYDVEEHIRKLRRLPRPRLRVVYASSANIHNPVINMHRMNLQAEAERADRRMEWGHKERDSLRSYISVRRERIGKTAPDFSAETADMLARATRGLNLADIDKAVLEYRRTGDIAYRPAHPTNTCDPFTGNWLEHLMDTGYLEGLLEENGFSAIVDSGYFSHKPEFYKRLFRYSLNIAIRILGRKGLFIAPYYIVHADRRASGPADETAP